MSEHSLKLKEHPSWEEAMFRAWAATSDPNDHYARTWLASPEHTAEQIIERVRALEEELAQAHAALSSRETEIAEVWCVFRYGHQHYMCLAEHRGLAMRDVADYFDAHSDAAGGLEEWPDFPDYVKPVTLSTLRFRCPTH